MQDARGNDEGADPTKDLRAQNPGATIAPDVGSRGESWGAEDKNISTEHQPEGAAGNPSDTLREPDETEGDQD